jgi:hypothetical protein
VPELPKDAPKDITFGVILFEYRGAQLASKTAPAKSEAYERAVSAARLATTNFEEAVKQGDRGSTGNAGMLPRGVLEPPIEYVLFSLTKGAVHPEPLDTPRGYWIVRRNL